jgi:hypothetical protein
VLHRSSDEHSIFPCTVEGQEAEVVEEPLREAERAGLIHSDSAGLFTFSELAFHFTQSNDRKRSAIYSQQAAEQALLSSAFKEAIVHYRVALKYMDADNEHHD